MTPKEVRHLLKTFGDIDSEDTTQECHRAFYYFMQNKTYGGPETIEAFYAFRAGWLACLLYFQDSAGF